MVQKPIHVKRKDMTPEERKANELHLRRSRLFSELSKKNREMEALREEIENLDPELRKLKREQRSIETKQRDLKIKMLKLQFDSLSDKEKRVLTKLGLNPYQQRQDTIYYRDTGTFEK